MDERTLAKYRYGRRELLGASLGDLRAPVTRPSRETQPAEAREKHGAVFETVHRRKNGTVFPVEVSKSAVETAGGIYYQLSGT